MGAISVWRMTIFPPLCNTVIFFQPDSGSCPDPADSAEIRRAGRGFSVSGGNPARDGGCVAERSRRRPPKPRNGARGKERSYGKPAFRISGCRQRRRNRVRRGVRGQPGAGGRRPCGEGRGVCGSCMAGAGFPARWNQTVFRKLDPAASPVRRVPRKPAVRTPNSPFPGISGGSPSLAGRRGDALEAAGMRRLQKCGGVNRARCVIHRKGIRARKGAPYENRTCHGLASPPLPDVTGHFTAKAASCAMTKIESRYGNGNPWPQGNQRQSRRR